MQNLQSNKKRPAPLAAARSADDMHPKSGILTVAKLILGILYVSLGKVKVLEESKEEAT